MKWLLDEKDKLQHLIGGIILSQIIVLCLSIFTTSIWLPIIISTIISTVVAYGKELLYDKILRHGVYNTKDFIASEIGVGYGIITSLLYLLL